MFKDKAARKKGSVLPAETLAELRRRLTEGAILPERAGTPVKIGQAELERLLPHRAPMLLVDGIDEVDPATRSIRGHRYLAESDPAFAGHFPGAPVYPGMFVVEALAQLAITLVHLADQWTLDVPDDTTPTRAHAVHIHGATFFASFAPGDTMVLHAHLIEYGTVAVMAGQAWKDGALAAVAVSELELGETTGREIHHAERPPAHANLERPSRRMPGSAFGHLPLEGFLD